MPESSPASSRLSFPETELLGILDGEEAIRGHAIEDLCQRFPHHAEEIRRTVAMPATEPAGPLHDTPELCVDGPYRLLRLLGQGGMGSVFLAYQTSPVRRRVALKVVRQGLNSREILARFKQECQALAMLSHECIAKVFDAGVTALGRPFMVMEYIPGIPISAYCDKKQLTVAARLSLLRRVCGAVQHAHECGVVHRDLKPSNVLVMERGNEAIPKIIDFGLARTIDHCSTEGAFLTAQGQVLGTPAYMSPEQAGLGGVEIDARTDVYALGVLLYELLTGVLPFSRGEVRHAAYAEMLKRIIEEDPPPPSTRLQCMGTSALAAARMRSIGLPRLVRTLRGALDWIVMRAIAKDRSMRYATAMGLDEDIARFLTDEPVQARPPSRPYRMRKFAKRHRVVLGLILSCVGSLSLGLAVQTPVREPRETGRSVAAEVVRDLVAWRASLPQMTRPVIGLGTLSDQSAFAVDTRAVLDRITVSVVKAGSILRLVDRPEQVTTQIRKERQARRDSGGQPGERLEPLLGADFLLRGSIKEVARQGVLWLELLDLETGERAWASEYRFEWRGSASDIYQ